MASTMKVGIMDILSKHLDFVTETFNRDPDHWQQLCTTFKFLALNLDPNWYTAKRDTQSVDLRNQGNVHFKAGRFPEARLFYTQSLAAGIGGDLGALAYSNRSAALFHMRLYKDCMKDIDRALVLGYPNHKLEYNLHLRKAMCMQFLKKDHTEALNEALMAIEEHNKGAIEELKTKVLAKMKDPEPVFNMDLPKPNKWKLPDLSYGPSAEVPSFSSAVSIKYSKELGRHLVANRPIKTGDVLVVEKCIVASVSEKVHWDFCGFCFKPCMSPIPCKLCGLIMYCSVSCRDNDWKSSHEHSCFVTRHSFEMPHEKVLDLNKPHRPSFGGIVSFNADRNCLFHRLIQAIGIEQIMKAAMQNKPLLSWSANDPRTKGFRDGKFNTVDLEALMSLEDNFEQLCFEEKEMFAKVALQLSAMLKIPQSEFLRVAAIFLKLLLVTVFNFKFIYAFKANYYRIGIPRISLGDGLYLAGSLINHACDGSMYTVAYGTNCIYRARRPIKKGEQLTDCHVISAANASYKERQALCEALYKFTCNCEACKNAWPLVDLMPKMSMLENDEMIKFMRAAKCAPTNPTMLSKFIYFCDYAIPADKEMLPKMVALLGEMNKSGAKMNQWYYKIQESIKNHYRTQGVCFFFKDAKEILKGAKKFDVADAISKIELRVEDCKEVPSPFGMKTYQF